MTMTTIDEPRLPAASRPMRVMWLLNHTAARRFEISMLKRMGIDEIFLPKRFPNDPGFRSASIDWSEDANLSIPPDDLQLLNATDWYSGANREAWEVANRHFDLLFFILHSPHILLQIGRHFCGIALWRAYGLQKEISYDVLISQSRDGRLRHAVDRLGSRLYFAEAYAHLADSEPDYLQRRRIYMPLGIAPARQQRAWQGNIAQILFVCPDAGFNEYYVSVYQQFKRDFADLPHVIGGAQPIKIDDNRVLGFVTAAEHEHNMTQNRVMYYHSSEPNHIHYHPFEAIQAGMPLVFMAGGILDRMGGVDLPGRCRSIKEAKHKLQRILGGDQALIESIRSSQTRMLDPMSPQTCAPFWQEAIKRLTADADTHRHERASRPAHTRQKRIAVCLPIAYKGGTLRGAIALAHALYLGSRQAGEPADIVLLHPDVPEYREDDFAHLPPHVSRRAFSWRELSAAQARRAMRYAGFACWEPDAERFIVPDDGIRQLQDCDLWVVVSDRLSLPLLPLRPHVLMVYDYLQRYEDVMPAGYDQPFLDAARHADRVLVTTRFTQQDALQYAGLEPDRVRRVPMLAPEMPCLDATPQKRAYFMWSTNSSVHKNHRHAAEALEIYYQELDGRLECWVTGVDSEHLLSSTMPHLHAMALVFKRSAKLRSRVRWKGNMDDRHYGPALASATFLWLPTRLDNGSFSVVEAGQLGVPALCADYPALHEMNHQFNLAIAWMDANDPRQMAEQLKSMEQHAECLAERLAGVDCLEGQRLNDLAGTYWQEVREYL